MKRVPVRFSFASYLDDRIEAVVNEFRRMYVNGSIIFCVLTYESDDDEWYIDKSGLVDQLSHG
jgi:hypothetical protein